MAFETTRLYLAASAFVLAWGIALLIGKLAWQLRLVQTPNERSSHSQPTPSGGGVGIAVAGFLGNLALLQGADSFAPIAMGLTMLAAVLGLLDDRFDLSSRLRLVVHVFIVGTLLATAGSLPPVPTPLGELPSALLYGVALLAGIWWINLFNFMDGIDGIAASQAAFMFVGMALLSDGVNADQTGWLAWWSIVLACASAGFLVVNWAPARIFMGDAGSNYLAVAALAIAAAFLARGILAYGTILVLGAAFITDATITLVTRALRRDSIMKAHRSHAYQKLARRWGRHSRVTLLYTAFNVIWLLPIAYLIEQDQPELLLVILAYLPAIVFCLWAKAGEPTEALVSQG